jgi:hypothetical protein
VLMQMVIIDFKKNVTKTKAQMAMCQCKWQQLTSRKQWASKSASRNLDSLPPVTPKLKIQSYGASPQWGPSHCIWIWNLNLGATKRVVTC